MRTVVRFCSASLLAAFGCAAWIGPGGALRGQAAVAAAPLGAIHTGSTLAWDDAFADRSGTRPLHFVADYTASGSTHRLEEWRSGVDHLRRRTDDRIDLHADRAAGSGGSYVWQVIDLKARIDNRISDRAMLGAGMFYSFYSMAHVLSRPAGRFTLTALPAEAPLQVSGQSCTWYELRPDSQPVTRVCWSAGLGLPLETRTFSMGGGLLSSFDLRSFDRGPIPGVLFSVNLNGLRVRDHDQASGDD